MTDMHDTADLVSKALRRAWQLGQTYWQQADSEYQSHLKRADATQGTFNQLVEDTRAAILAANSSAQPTPSVPREAIEKMLTQLMDIAVSNGANSISMPDEYVEVAAWLCGIPAQQAPSVPDTDAAGINAVAAMLQSKADEYAKEHGHDDMGVLSFGPGMGGEIKMDYYTNLLELVDDVRAMLAAALEVKL